MIDESWSWIWNLKLPENISHFVWLIMHESLPTNHFRHSRHVTNDPSCHRCGAMHETIIHTLRDCPHAKRIWNSVGYMTPHSFFGPHDSRGWLKAHAQGGNGQLFVLICWFVWRSRNAEAFSDDKWPLWRINNLIWSNMDSISIGLGSSTNMKSPRFIAWHRPEGETVKLNVDGSSFGNPGRSGYGGLIRNNSGGWLIGFSGSCGYSTNLNAELQAILYGLDLAWNEGYRNVECESDSKTSLLMIAEGVPYTHPHAPIVDHIRSFLQRHWTLTFHHSLREGNFCADWLAKFGSSKSNGSRIWSLCPSALSSTLLADAMGIERPRV